MHIGVTGLKSTITQEVLSRMNATPLWIKGGDINLIPKRADFYLLCSGLIRNIRIQKQTNEEMSETGLVNLLKPIQLSEKILYENENAVICIVGSESGFKGSYDMAYAASKAGIHWYVENQKIKDTQRLFSIAPHIIRDSNMAKRRHDYKNIKNDSKHVTSKEVAEVIVESYEKGITGRVIRLSPS